MVSDDDVLLAVVVATEVRDYYRGAFNKNEEIESTGLGTSRGVALLESRKLMYVFCSNIVL